ncbi:T9SS type A sorting domain-containing protein [candidate division WOR-3 bacterium]|uniref:T9SS type A sorting domain-containing protein n=1 Tax=candidate division WOR-3 bacterium TaxID=2052148 RepID=A0A9D5KB69_UNCW3|nr:T9SS type A sorting domain-containing protein [candidate division WOR-3 bacterium]MBD3365510.1 T9SS type A sorting domain-containing protein [candidate division WOR-3 bacterium]
MIKTDSLGLLGVNEEPVIEADRGWEISSRIGRRIAVFYEDLPQGFHARVYNAAGQQVAEIHTSGSSGFVTWGTGHPPGVYFISAPNKLNQTITAKVVILH